MAESPETVEDEAVVELPARTIPIPLSISPEARARLAALERQSDKSPTWPDTMDPDVWKEAIAYADSYYATFLADLDKVPGIAESTEEVAGRPVYVAEPEGAPGDCAYLDIHGGALVAIGGDLCRLSGKSTAMMTGLRTYSIDYRMPPDHPFPAALDDCIAAYRFMLDCYGPDRIVVGGVSAGGNLSAALIVRARDEGLPMPAGLALITPELDLTESGDTFQTVGRLDVVQRAELGSANALYAGGQPLDHPYISPLFADVTGFPRTLLQAGTRDKFLSNAARFHRKLRQAGIDAELHVFEAMPHGGFGGVPEDADKAAEVKRFVDRCLD